jgi:hypothetical protein
MKNYKDFINNKKVLIVGPASYLKEYPILDEMIKYDTVIRVNSSIDLATKIPEIVGNRTDVVFTTCDIDRASGTNHRKVKSWIDNKVKHVRISPPAINSSFSRNIESFKRENKERIPFSIVSASKYNDQIKLCKDSIPNTGFSAILDCLTFEPKKIHISGITFFKGGYMPEYDVATKTEKEVRDFFTRVNSHHNIDKQIQAFKKIIKENNLITCDEYILGVMGL